MGDFISSGAPDRRRALSTPDHRMELSCMGERRSCRGSEESCQAAAWKFLQVEASTALHRGFKSVDGTGLKSKRKSGSNLAIE